MSGLRERQATGLDYLELVTTLLQTARRAHPTAGVWEAGDLQWWWRRDQHADSAEATFWLDGGQPVAAVVCMNWGDRIGCDVLGTDPDGAVAMEVAWPHARRHIETHHDLPVEMTITDDNIPLLDAIASAGFAPTADVGVPTWMPASARPPVPPLPSGFTLVSRTDDPVRPHPMIDRNGEQVAERLAECSLYRSELDLAIYDPDGEVAGYSLFWADPVTGVGLVEPMRTEDRYHRKGLGRVILAAGLERLAAQGCERLKVGYIAGNEGARRLYLGAGFTPGVHDRTYRRTVLGSGHRRARPVDVVGGC